MGKATENLARVTPIGLDLAKTVFQFAASAQGELAITRKLRRETNLKFFGRLAPCVVAMGAYGSPHHWGRQLVALGREVKTDPAGACKVIRTAQQDGCGRRGGYPRGGDAPPPAVRRFAFERQPGGGDASSGS
jgi:transposase